MSEQEIEDMVDFLEESMEIYREDNVYEIRVCAECQERDITRHGNHIDDPLEYDELDCEHDYASWPLVMYQSPHESHEIQFTINLLNYLLQDFRDEPTAGDMR
ncbi:hypothetical protein [Natrinema salinisoli]|uniref:hypothetical protein n=1 Tax=Natrinema salinisoli TaxID=2878535 RepID=UPI001CEFC278|nr:hypothetical protein [Natrinema salinisoli]